MEEPLKTVAEVEQPSVETQTFPAEGDVFTSALRILWPERRRIWKYIWIGAIVAAVIAFVTPMRYESTVRVVPPEPNKSTAALLATASGAGGSMAAAADMLGVKTPGALIIGVLKSRSVQDYVIDTNDLRKVYRTPYYLYTREELDKRTNIDEDKRSSIVTVSVWDHDPARAQRIAQSYVDALNHAMSGVNTSAAHRERLFIEERLKGVKVDLDAAQKEFSEFSSKNTAINIGEQGKAMLTAAATAQGELMAAKSELASLEQIYTPTNVRVRSVQARISELQAELNKFGGAGDENANASSIYPSIRKLPILGVQYADLYRRVRIQEALFETLSKQYEIAKIDEAKEVATVSVLDTPSWPEKKVYPHRLPMILVGMFLAACLGMVRVLGEAVWIAVDDSDPRKALLMDMGESMRESRIGRLLRKPMLRMSSANVKLAFPFRRRKRDSQ